MKRMRNVLAILLLMAMMVTTCACGQQADPKEGVDALMTMMTQGDVTKYCAFTGESEEEAQKEYQEMLDSIKSSLSTFDVSEETKTKVTEAFAAVLKKAKYTVNDAEKTDDGYDVKVDIEPITGLYEKMTEKMQKELESAYASGEVTQDNMYDWVFDKMAGWMTEDLDSLTYGDPQSVTVHITKDGNKFKIEDEYNTGMEIGKLLIDQSGI